MPSQPHASRGPQHPRKRAPALTLTHVSHAPSPGPEVCSPGHCFGDRRGFLPDRSVRALLTSAVPFREEVRPAVLLGTRSRQLLHAAHLQPLGECAVSLLPKASLDGCSKNILEASSRMAPSGAVWNRTLNEPESRTGLQASPESSSSSAPDSATSPCGWQPLRPAFPACAGARGVSGRGWRASRTPEGSPGGVASAEPSPVPVPQRGLRPRQGPRRLPHGSRAGARARLPPGCPVAGPRGREGFTPPWPAHV